MEATNVINKNQDVSCSNNLKSDHCFTSNWLVIQNNKQLSDVFSRIPASKASSRLTLEDIVTDDSYIILQHGNANVDNTTEACVIDINLTNNERIVKIGIVSEASVLELFKKSGEYAGTIYAEFIDEFEDATVYLAEFNFPVPTSEASIKFTRIHNNLRNNMYLYGIKLVLDDDKSSVKDSSIFNETVKSLYSENMPDINRIPMDLRAFTNLPDYDVNNTIDMNACFRNFMEKAWSRPRTTQSKKRDAIIPVDTEIPQNRVDEVVKQKEFNIEQYIDDKFRDFEKRLMLRIDEVEAITNRKLDAILEHLQSRENVS